MNEHYLWIPGYVNLYSISNFANIYSYSSQCFKKPTLRDDGYLTISLYKNNISETKLLHRLVLETFVGQAPPNHEARHYPDFTRTNCRLDNLQWSTHIVNEQDKENVLSDEQVIQIKEKLLQLKHHKKVADYFRIDPVIISQIARGQTYSHIGPDISKIKTDSRIRVPIEIIIQIKKEIKNGNKSVTEIIKELGINRAYYYRIKNNEIHSDIII